MRADLNDDQTMLAETVSRLLADRYDFETRRGLLHAEPGWSRPLWADLAELGVLAALTPEDAGGLGGQGVEAMVIAQALGAVLSAEPVAPAVLMAPPALLLAGRGDALGDVAAGDCAVAWIDVADVKVAQGRLSGAAVSAPWANAADRLLVAADGEAGPWLLWIDPSREGVTRRAHRTFDGLAAADVAFHDLILTEEDVLARGAAAEARIGQARSQRLAWLTAEAVGLMQMALDATVEHLKSRVQFGQPLAGFQALQHRAAEMLVALEQGRSAAILAAAALQQADPLAQARDIAAAKLVVSEAARVVAQGAVQLHGGIGVTEEHKVGWAFRRLTMIEMLCGDADAQAVRLADLGGFVDAD
jgi:alkylation response protein AidB-like acyl-CoA dehydrogenase